MVNPFTPPDAFFWSTANLTPLAVDWPPVVQTGRSEPILIVPFDPEPPLPPLVPHAKAIIAADVRTTSPLARTIWFPLVLLGRGTTKPDLPSLAALFPTKSGRECAGGECGHMGWPNRYSDATIDSLGPASQVESRLEPAAPSIRGCGAVIHGLGELPGQLRVGAGGFEDRQDPVGRVPRGVEGKCAGRAAEGGGGGELRDHVAARRDAAVVGADGSVKRRVQDRSRVVGEDRVRPVIAGPGKGGLEGCDGWRGVRRRGRVWGRHRREDAGAVVAGARDAGRVL